MTYTIGYTETAENLIWQQAQHIAEASGFVNRAIDWLQDLYRAIERLEQSPRGCNIAEEDREFPYEVRKLIVGEYLVLFRIDDEASRVIVIGLRHGARLPFGPTDLSIE